MYGTTIKVCSKVHNRKIVVVHAIVNVKDTDKSTDFSVLLIFCKLVITLRCCYLKR